MGLYSFVVTISLGVMLSGYRPRPGDGALLVAFDAGILFALVALWVIRLGQET